MTEVLALCAKARKPSSGWFDPWALPGGVDPTGLVKSRAARRAAVEAGLKPVGRARSEALMLLADGSAAAAAGFPIIAKPAACSSRRVAER